MIHMVPISAMLRKYCNAMRC